MSHDLPHEKQQAHELIERLPPHQLTAVVGLLEAMLDPVSRAIAQAPIDDEPVTAQEEKALTEAQEWLKRPQAYPPRAGVGRPRHHASRNRQLSGPGVKRLVWTEFAKADIQALDKPTALRILSALHRFAESGAGDVKALQGEREELRLRIGDYRLFFVYTPADTIEIRRVLHRKEAYR